jgi:hypothetical protein
MWAVVLALVAVSAVQCVSAGLASPPSGTEPSSQIATIGPKKHETAETGADGLTTDKSKWRLVRADARLYADDQSYEQATQYEAEHRRPALLRMTGEDRYTKAATPLKAEFLEENGPHRMCKVRYFSRIREQTFDKWVAESDVIPYDEDLWKKTVLEAERKGRTHAIKVMRDQLKRFQGKVVRIKEHALLFSEDAFWQFITWVIQREDKLATKKTIEWVQTYDGSAILTGKDSLGVVTSIEGPFYKYLKIESDFNGQKTTFWVSANDVSFATESVSPIVHRTGKLTSGAAGERAKEAAKKAIGNADQVQQAVPRQLSAADVAKLNEPDDDVPDITGSDAENNNPKEQQEERPTPTQDEGDFRAFFNKQFRLGNYSYKITSVRVAKAVGPEFVRAKASEGAVYVMVNFLIRNDGKQTAETMADDFRLTDSEGREFSPDSHATTVISPDFVLRELHPGVFKKAVTVFEVPDNVIKANFKIIVPEKGLLKLNKRRAILSLTPAD